MASPAQCPTGKRRFAEGLDLAFLAGNDRLVYSRESDGRTVSLGYAPIVLDGTHLGASVPIFSRYASRLFWVVPQYDAVIFKLAVDNPHLDGVYLRPLP